MDSHSERWLYSSYATLSSSPTEVQDVLAHAYVV
jgi:hypothetical protein